jgi:hypothetical protein
MRLNGDLAIDDDLIVTGDVDAAGRLKLTGAEPQIQLEAGLPMIRWTELAAPVDNKHWRLFTSGNLFRLDCHNDAGTVITSLFTVARGDGAITFYGPAYIKSGNASLYLYDPNQPANLRMLRIMNQGQQFRFYAQNDDESGFVLLMTIDRTGNMTVTGNMQATRVIGSASGNNLADLTVGPTNFQAGVTVTGGSITVAAPGAISAPGGLVNTPVPDASLSANVALKNVTNYFTAAQSMFAGSVITGPNGHLIFVDTSAPVDAQVMRLLSYSDGSYRFEALNNAQTVIQGAPIRMFRNGNVTIGGFLVAQSGVYERTRSFPMGEWKDGGIANYGPYINNAVSSYTMIGGTVFLTVQIISAPLPTPLSVYTIYHNWTAQRRSSCGGEATLGGNHIPATATALQGSNAIELRPGEQMAWPAGDLAMCFTIPINILGVT